MPEPSPLHHCIQFNMSIAESLGDNEQGPVARSVHGFLKRHGVPEGTPVKIESVRRRYWYEVTASWTDNEVNA